MYILDTLNSVTSTTTAASTISLPSFESTSLGVTKNTIVYSDDLGMASTVNLMADKDVSQRKRRSQESSTSLYSHLAEQRFQKNLRSAELYIKYFIVGYISVWTLPTQNTTMSAEVALLHLPGIKGYLQHETSLSKVQRLNLIKTMLVRMKRVLPNTVRLDKRHEEMTSRVGVLRYLKNIEDIVDLLKQLLATPDGATADQDRSQLDAADIRSPLTILAAAKVIEDKLKSLDH